MGEDGGGSGSRVREEGGGVGSLEVHCHLQSLEQVQLQMVQTARVEQLFPFVSGLVIVPKSAR